MGALFCILALPFNPVELTGFGLIGMAHTLFLAFICSAACFSFYNYAIKRLRTCTIFINLQPVVKFFIGTLLLWEIITPLQSFGTALVYLRVDNNNTGFLHTGSEKGFSPNTARGRRES